MLPNAAPRDNDCRFAEFLRIIDGDTFQARIHLAPRVRPRVEIVASIRVHNWNAAELNEPEGKHLRDLFEEMLRTAGRIDVVMKTMSFERIVCAVWIDGELFAGILTHELLEYRRANAANAGTAGVVDPVPGSGVQSATSGVDQTDHDADRVRDEEFAEGLKGAIGLDRAEGRG